MLSEDPVKNALLWLLIALPGILTMALVFSLGGRAPRRQEWPDTPGKPSTLSPRREAAPTHDEKSSDWREHRYGDHHQRERARWSAIISREGSWCSEPFCVMQSRRIEPGAFFHLSHDHVKGGTRDYLGPSHPECNEHEARRRGVVFERDPEYSHDPSRSERVEDPWATPRADEDEEECPN